MRPYHDDTVARQKIECPMILKGVKLTLEKLRISGYFSFKSSIHDRPTKARNVIFSEPFALYIR